jgi:hypothetical protein
MTGEIRMHREIPGTHRYKQRKGHDSTQREDSHLPDTARAHLPAPSFVFYLPEFKTIKFYCLSHPSEVFYYSSPKKMNEVLL